MKEVKAEMSGIVYKILVKPGDVVEEGARLVVLESMKMEIPVLSPYQGVVKEVMVGEKDFIQEGDTLVVLA